MLPSHPDGGTPAANDATRARTLVDEASVRLRRHNDTLTDKRVVSRGRTAIVGRP
jgi:hypothetical protein